MNLRLLSTQGKVRPQAETDCVQHLSNQLRRHRYHRHITSLRQQRVALRRIRQLQQTVLYIKYYPVYTIMLTVLIMSFIVVPSKTADS